MIWCHLWGAADTRHKGWGSCKLSHGTRDKAAEGQPLMARADPQRCPWQRPPRPRCYQPWRHPPLSSEAAAAAHPDPGCKKRKEEWGANGGNGKYWMVKVTYRRSEDRLSSLAEIRMTRRWNVKCQYPYHFSFVLKPGIVEFSLSICLSKKVSENIFHFEQSYVLQRQFLLFSNELPSWQAFPQIWILCTDHFCSLPWSFPIWRLIIKRMSGKLFCKDYWLL